MPWPTSLCLSVCLDVHEDIGKGPAAHRALVVPLLLGQVRLGFLQVRLPRLVLVQLPLPQEGEVDDGAQQLPEPQLLRFYQVLHMKPITSSNIVVVSCA